MYISSVRTVMTEETICMLSFYPLLFLVPNVVVQICFVRRTGRLYKHSSFMQGRTATIFCHVFLIVVYFSTIINPISWIYSSIEYGKYYLILQSIILEYYFILL